MSLDHIKQTEKAMGTKFDIGNFTSHTKCNGPCDLLAKVKDYKVQDLGVDSDILNVKKSLKEAESETGFKWNVN